MIDLDDVQKVACSLGHDLDQVRVTKRWLVQALAELRAARREASEARISRPVSHCPLLDAVA